ncbi:MAG: P-type DNA transfer ATPase VirB11 [Alphaproteobacteria bacterium CG11_big_fil_rev_8_21_14_0_20_44_7]|nr:MAG: P-type DNA transfer ATPase VirB11 [Alphaproteobacteria bacterium CG11_big_fil_rev_8_21_14_0_20_44_7]
MSTTALETYLKPLQRIFAIENVVEISINTPGEVWYEVKGEMYHEKVPELDINHLKALGRLVAQYTEQAVSEEAPLLSATLPSGYRIQVVFPPACEAGKVAISIRKQTVLNLDLDQYEAIGAFESTISEEHEDKLNVELSKLLDRGEVKEFIKRAVRGRKNIIVSGGTSTGKTTFMNAALKEISPSERIITVEDAREIELNHLPNKVHLIASRGGQGRAKVTTQDLIQACLRLRPDRIIVGELRGSEAFAFLRAVNTGHPGSISTIHADTPRLAFEQLILMVMQAGLGMTRETIYEYVHSVINIIIQLKRGEGGKRYVSEVYFKDRISNTQKNV